MCPYKKLLLKLNSVVQYSSLAIPRPCRQEREKEYFVFCIFFFFFFLNCEKFPGGLREYAMENIIPFAFSHRCTFLNLEERINHIYVCCSMLRSSSLSHTVCHLKNSRLYKRLDDMNIKEQTQFASPWPDYHRLGMQRRNTDFSLSTEVSAAVDWPNLSVGPPSTPQDA